MRVKGFTLRQAVPADAEWFACRLRSADLAEVLAFYDDPLNALRNAISVSQICVVAERGGQGVILLGCADNLVHGVPWLMATDEVTTHPGALTKIAKHYVGLFLERWPALLNYVDERNAVSVHWLRRLGFTIGEARKFGRNGERFHPFTMGR